MPQDDGPRRRCGSIARSPWPHAYGCGTSPCPLGNQAGRSSPHGGWGGYGTRGYRGAGRSPAREFASPCWASERPTRTGGRARWQWTLTVPGPRSDGLPPAGFYIQPSAYFQQHQHTHSCYRAAAGAAIAASAPSSPAAHSLGLCCGDPNPDRPTTSRRCR